MTEKIKEIIQNRDIVIPRLLFMNYKALELTEQELILIIYILNTSEIFNPKQISNDLNITLNNVMELMEDLTSKGIIKLELKKIGNIRNEYINLDGLYEKLTFKILNKEEPEKQSNIYSIFEEEFGRPISAMEVEIISAWIENGTSEETIKLALKEATYNGVTNLRYIDRIISEWSKKGIKTQEDVEKSRMNFRQKKEAKPKNDILNYDWLNDK
ncbi:MAG: DnaD domain-containing protein [Bacilli bacterium]